MTIKSMTGYGMASAGTGFTAEIKSVNHKFLEIRLHLPADLQPAEPMILEHMRRILKRGSVEVILSRCGDSTVSVRKPRLNRELAKRYIDMALELKKMSGDQGTVDLSTLLTMKDLIDYEVSESDVTEVMNAIRPALDAACGRYDEMRTREGEAVGAALLRFLDNIESKTAVIETEAPKSIVAYREKLASRIAQIRGDVQPDSYRLEQEVAYCAEKCDVAEEIDRLKSHISQFRSLFAEGGQCGKKMDFIIQEMNRETNTIGSKTQSTINSCLVIEVKGELDRMREQVQNIE